MTAHTYTRARAHTHTRMLAAPCFRCMTSAPSCRCHGDALRCRCVAEVNQRFLVGGAKFKCKVVDKVMKLQLLQ